MGGGANLTCLAALKNGAGLARDVYPTNFFTAPPPGQAPEIMTVTPHNAPEFFTEEHAEFVEQLAESREAVVLGWGLGVHSQTAGFVQQLTKHLEGPF
ncbi:MAG: hypothetical protein CM1200mP30_31860 [Pseudomonadota bacterium]|nr:MAG: hypothetical protein CM1200mP30_31860 [Pseudomonadota bacterium]